MCVKLMLWWKRSTRTDHILMGFVGITIIVIIALALVIGLWPKKQVICLSRSCLAESVKLQRYTDTTKDPCQDFFGFACGRAYTALNIEDDLTFFDLEMKQVKHVCNREIREREHPLIKLTKRLYQTCLNNTQASKEDSNRIIRNALKAAGGWPVVLGDKWDEQQFDWKNASYTFRQLGYIDDFFVNIAVNRDEENKSKFILEVMLSEVYNYPYELMHINKTKVIVEIAQLLGANTSRDIAQELIEVQKFQDMLQTYSYKKNEGNLHLKYTIGEYQNLCGYIDWLEFINNMLGPNVQVDSNQIALFPPPEVFQKWLNLFLKEPKRVQANYIMWKFVENILPYASPEFMSYKMELRTLHQRDEFCFNTITDMGLLYPAQSLVHRNFVEVERKKGLNTFLNNFRNELVERLESSPLFITPGTEKVLKRIKDLKMEAIPNAGAESNIIFEKSVVENINITETSFLKLLAQARKNSRTLEYLRVLDDPNLYIPKLNLRLPFYDKEANEINAIGLALHDFFEEGRPNFINYGVVAAMISHVLGDMLVSSKHTNQTVLNMGKCLSDNSFGYNESLIEGSLAISLQVAYIVYEKYVNKHGKEAPIINTNNTATQLFWLSSVQSFCKPRVFHGRYNKKLFHPNIYIFDVLKNSRRFGADFNCRIGSRMSADYKCSYL